MSDIETLLQFESEEGEEKLILSFHSRFTFNTTPIKLKIEEYGFAATDIRLTPQQARELGYKLIEACDRAEEPTRKTQYE